MDTLTEDQIGEHQELKSLVDEYDTAAPERQQEIYEQLAEQQTRQEEAVRYQRLTDAQKYFNDLDTLGGTWTAQQQSLFAGGATADLQADKASVANIHYLAAEGGHSEEDVAKAYPLLREQFGQREFGVQGVTDQNLYERIQGRIAQGKERAEGLSKIASIASEAGLDDLAAEESGTNVLRPTITIRGVPGVADDEGEELFYRIYDHTRELGKNNRELTHVLRDVMARTTGRSGDEGRLKEDDNAFGTAAQQLADLKPEDRRAVLGGLAVWAQNHPEAKNFFPQLGESFGRGVSGAVRGVGSMMSDAMLTQTRMNLLSDNAKVMKGQPASLLTLESNMRRDQSLNGVTEFGMSAPVFEPMRPVTAEERQQLLHEVDKALRVNQVTRELHHYAENVVDPIRDVLPKDAPWIMHRLEHGSYMAANAAGPIGVSFIPYVGPAAAIAGMTGQEYNRLKVEHPEMSVGDAAAIASVSGAIQGTLQAARVGQMLRRLPHLGDALAKLSTPGSGFWRQYAPSVAGHVVTQGIEQVGFNLAPAVAQNLIAAINQDVPGVKLQEALGGLDQNVESLIAGLPWALVGVAVQSVQDNAIVRRGLHHPEEMTYFGIDPEAASRIAETANKDELAAQRLFREAWKLRTPEAIAQGQVRFKVKLEEARTREPSNAHQFEVIGTATYKATAWKRNPKGEKRTVERAKEIAEENGIHVPDDVEIIPSEPGRLGNDVYANYGIFEHRPGDDTFKIYWKTFYTINGKIPIRLDKTVLASDEAIVEVFAHELYEIADLRSRLTNGRFMSLATIRALTQEPFGVVHLKALLFGQEKLNQMRQRKKDDQ